MVKILEILPPDLDATYDRILQRVEPMFKQEVFTALQWLVFAQRPLYLEELAEAAIIDPTCNSPVDPSRRFAGSDIAELLSGLIVIEPEPNEPNSAQPRTHSVSLAHFSVQEYLLSTGGSPERAFWSLNESISHERITMSCMAYIQHCFTASLSDQTDSSPLRSYCLDYWAEHATSITEETSNKVWNIVISTLTDRKLAEYWIQHGRVYWREALSFKSSSFKLSPYINDAVLPYLERHRYYPIYHCVIFRLYKVVELLLEGHKLPFRTPQYGATLEAAMLLADRLLTRILLEHGVHFRQSFKLALRLQKSKIAHDLLFWGYQVQGSDLILAARRCSLDMVTLILRSTENFKIEDYLLAINASLFGSKGVTEALLRTALDKDAKPFASGDLQHTEKMFQILFRTACKMGLHCIVDVLTGLNASSTLSLCNYDKAFKSAISGAHVEVIKTILNSPAKAMITYRSFAKAFKKTVRKRMYVRSDKTSSVEYHNRVKLRQLCFRNCNRY